MSIEYNVSIVDADAHLIDVQLSVSNPDPSGQQLRLPAWIPGSYMIRDFSRNIVSIEALANGQPVTLEKLDKSTWVAPAQLSQLLVRYRVYAWDLSVRSAHVDRTHAFFNGTSVFLGVTGQEDGLHEVTFERPAHDVEQGFQLATTLEPVQIDSAGFGRYRASDYDDLIDHPVEQGTFKKLAFEACGVEHEVVFTGACFFDEERVTADLKRICEYEIQFFGQPAPFKKYLFLTMVVDAGYGGLEHRSSTALMITRENLPVPGVAELSDKYLEFLGLCSHEYFHNWNVKRIKPAQFVPYELAAESYTELLWFFEGMTSYYDDLFLVRCGLIDNERYLGLLAKTLTRVNRGAGRLVQTVTESSFDAWNKFYKQDENAPNSIVSYYAKGALIALCLDSMMRESSAGKISLDTLMKTLWARWLEGIPGVAEDEPQTAVAELLDADVTAFFDSVLYSTDELPLNTTLERFGVTLAWKARSNATDMGGVRALPRDSSKVGKEPWTGALLVPAPGGVRVTHVLSGSPAEQAGLAAGDTVVAINSLSVDRQSFDDHMARYASTESVSLHYFRLGQLHDTALPVLSPPLDTAVLAVADDELIKSWLHDDRALDAESTPYGNMS